MKEYGAELKKKLDKSYRELNNVHGKIFDRYFMIIENYHEYVDYSIVKRIEGSILSQGNKHEIRCLMVEMIMKAEADYVKKNSKQLELFN